MYPVMVQTGLKSTKVVQTVGKSVCVKLLRPMSSDKSAGVELPPEPTTCCMSGCANCVWVEYAETVAKLLNDTDGEKARDIVLDKIQDPNLKMFLKVEMSNIQYKLEQLQLHRQQEEENLKKSPTESGSEK